MNPEQVEQTLTTVKRLNKIAKNRNQSLAQMSLAWNLRKSELACVLIGASRAEQVVDNVRALDNLKFSSEELSEIDKALSEQGNISWGAH